MSQLTFTLTMVFVRDTERILCVGLMYLQIHIIIYLKVKARLIGQLRFTNLFKCYFIMLILIYVKIRLSSPLFVQVVLQELFTYHYHNHHHHDFHHITIIIYLTFT